jgi:hypothetical protein
MAALLALTIASKIHNAVRGVTGCAGHASATDANANGKAKTVWEKRIRLP